MNQQLFAHFRINDHTPQFLENHLNGVSRLTGVFANKIGLKEIGEVIGLLHDFGKASQEFQAYIKSATGLIEPEADEYIDSLARKGKIDHSSAGAQIIYKSLVDRYPLNLALAEILALCVASHHSGLIDCISPSGEDIFSQRIAKDEQFTHSTEVLGRLPELATKINELITGQIELAFRQKLDQIKEPEDSKDTLLFKLGLLIRFILSCLIDADRLDAADFEIPNKSINRNYGNYRSWDILIERLNVKLSTFHQHKNSVNDLRESISQSCLDFASRRQGTFQLTVPTGGGKTLASLRFALHHAKVHGLDRVFYIIPYTSIIDQNADEIRKILEDKDESGQLGSNVVLEHHSNLTPEEETWQQKLLAENWDAPIVITTQVQFLEALFGSSTRSARRMHLLANSVIIFDEVQTIPIRCVHMFNLALRFLTKGCGATVVLCTATQPLLDRVEPKQRALFIQPDQHIISDENQLFGKLKRVEIIDHRKDGGWGEEEVTDLVESELDKNGSVLIVVNTKKSARLLYQSILRRKITDVYHLSTNMCPAHRLDVLTDVRKKLKNSQRVICVSTQLIEAGVDIDFGTVVRYLASLDSIVQAAGRCNRNGERPVGNVWIVNPRDENVDRLRDIAIGIEQTKRVLDEFNQNPDFFGNDRMSLDTLATYYQYYFYHRKDEMSYRVGASSSVGRDDNLFNLLSVNALSVSEYRRINQSMNRHPFCQAFQTASKFFHAIDPLAQGVVVPYGVEGKQIIADLCGTLDLETQFDLLKKAQRYSVNLYVPREIEKMVTAQAIHEVQKDSRMYYFDEQFYSHEFGWYEDPM